MLTQKIIDKTRRFGLGVQYKLLQSKLSFIPEKALIVAGDPRGGSTWLAELVNHISRTAMLWEPLTISEVPQFKSLEFGWRQYIPEEADWHEAKREFESLFSGSILSNFLCMRTSPEELKKASHLLVKFCRANQLLPWLTKQFEFKYSPIYLTRHPCSVIASQLKQGGWSHVPAHFDMPTGPFASIYSEHETFLHAIDTVEKRLAAWWCLCNSVPLHHPENNKRWITVTYEQLLLDGEAQLKRIERRWGLEFPGSVFEELGAPSRTTVDGSPIQNGKVYDQLKYWQQRLNSKQIDDVLSVLDYFGVSLYDSGALPTKSYEY